MKKYRYILSTLIIIFAIFLFFPSFSEAGTLGYTTIGGTLAQRGNSTSDLINAQKWLMSESGDISSFSIYGAKNGATNSLLKFSIYSDSASYPNNRVGNTSGILTVNSLTNQWWTQTAGASISLTATNYWITWHLDNITGTDYFNNYYDAAGTGVSGLSAGVYDTPPATFPASLGSNTRKESFYATYQAAAGAVEKINRSVIIEEE